MGPSVAFTISDAGSIRERWRALGRIRPRESREEPMSRSPTRHLAAVMFTDVAGYTALMQRAEEAALEARSRHRAALYDVVPAHGGEVVQFLGDGGVSMFPSSVEAVRAAIQIQNALSAHPRLPLRIGIHQGEITYDEQGILGDSVNIAARVQALAVPGGIVVTGKVVDELRNQRDLSILGLGEVLLKGIDRPMPVYAMTAPGVVAPEAAAPETRSPPVDLSGGRAAGEGPGPAGTGQPEPDTDRAPDLPPLPLVGREADLSIILERLDAAESGVGGTLFLSGDSGVGKTRLAGAVRDEARRRGWGVAVGRANPIESGLPYALLADALMPTIQALSDEARANMSRGVLDELAVLFPTLARLRPGGEAPRARESTDFRNRLFWNFAQFIEDLSRAAPVLVVLEDLHWADASSLELFHFLARQTKSARIVFIGTYRDDVESLKDGLRDIERSLISLDVATPHTVRPLSYAGTNELVRRTFAIPETMSRPFTALLFGWTRGNPFFIEEILKTLIESRRLRHEAGVWVGWDVEELALPESVRETVTLRAGRLNAAATRVAELAAVLGDRFRFDQLEAVTGLSAMELLPIVEELERHRILIEASHGESVILEFEHPIVRETLYANLGRARAGVLHGVVAQALERYHDASELAHVGELAYHYARAIDRSLAEKAVRFLDAAGRAALDARANPEARKYLSAALDRIDNGIVSRTPAEIARTISSLAHAHQRMGQTEAAIALWKRARTMAVAADDAEGIARIERRLGLANYWTGETAQALEHFEAGAAAAREAGDEVRLAMLRIAKGLCLQELGRAEDSLKELEAALEQARTLGAPSLLARVHRALLLIYLWTGPPDLAVTHGQSALDLAEKTGDIVLSFWVHWALAVLAGLTGDARSLVAHIECCDAVAEKLRSPLLRMWSSEIAVEFAFGSGRWDEGLAIGENAISMARALHQTTLLPRLLVWTALIHLGRNELERGTAYTDEAWELACGRPADDPAGDGPAGTEGQTRLRPTAVPSVHAVIPAHIGRAAAHLARGNYADAIAVAEAALEIVDQTGYDVWAIHRLLPIAAEAALYLRDIERAQRYGARLRESAERFGNKLGLAWADACDALVVWLNGDAAGGADRMRQAAAALEAIPFLPDATRLRRQLAGRLVEIGDRDAAVRELNLVYKTLLELGAEGELQRVREQFIEIGARPPTRPSSPGAAGLTGRELEVARLVTRDMSNKAIAQKLGISRRTVTTHVSSIFRKLGVTRRQKVADAIRKAEQAGEIKRRPTGRKPRRLSP
jgi:predicted ATPase/class 3 adenylate cyclase/DNA-binding CsgD family transcriptional regulator